MEKSYNSLPDEGDNPSLNGKRFKSNIVALVVIVLLVLPFSIPSHMTPICKSMSIDGTDHGALASYPPEFPQPDIQNNVTLNELNLTGNQVMTIENTNLTVNGQIYLQDNSELIVRQSIINIRHHPGRIILMSGSAILQAETTIFGEMGLVGDIEELEGSKEAVDISVADNAKLFMNNSFVILVSFLGNATGDIRNSYVFQEPLGVVHVEQGANVYVEDSILGSVFLDIPPEIPLTIDGLQPGYLGHWSVHENISSSLPFNIVLNRTEIKENSKGYEGGIEMGWSVSVSSKNTINISNSKLNKLAIGFEPTEYAVLWNLETRKPIDFDYNSIHLINTEVQTQWNIGLNGGGATIHDSRGVWLWMNGGSGNINIINSHINEIDPREYSGTMIMDNASWCCGYEIFDSTDMYVEGSVRMLKTVPIFDSTSRLTRHYDVFLLKDADGSAWPDVELVLSKDGIPIWGGTTDVEGRIGFDITFDYDNYQDNWVLSSPDTTINLNKTFSILMSNPVKISLELAEDGVHYRPVIHVDQAQALGFPFGTRESPYPSIWEAIDNSGGDIVRASQGVYTGHLPPWEKRGVISLKDNLILLGDGADNTTIAGQVWAENSQDVQISYFTIEDGIDALSSSLTITHNIIANHSAPAIHASRSTLSIINNVLANNGESGIFLADSCNATIKNNIIVNNALFGIGGVPSSSAIIDYNDVWNHTDNYVEFLPAGPHDRSVDPMFVDASGGNYHLQPGSPCIDAGDPDPKYNDPDGSRNDMGAFGGARNFVIPEFPSLIILPLFMIATLIVAVIFHRRKHSM